MNLPAAHCGSGSKHLDDGTGAAWEMCAKSIMQQERDLLHANATSMPRGEASSLNKFMTK